MSPVLSRVFRESEARGINPANHTHRDANGRSFAYLGDSEAVVRQYAGRDVYEEGYHVFAMKPEFWNEFHPSIYRRFHDDEGGLQWVIEDYEFEDFNELIDHSLTEWVPWRKNIEFKVGE